MNTKALIQNNKLATKKLILEKAVSLFAQKGFNGVSMRDLAVACSITPGALYYYFPNKKSLHEAAIIYAYRDRARPAVDSLEESGMGPMEILEKFVLRLSERFYNDSEFRRIVQWTILDSETDEVIRNIILDVVYETHFDSLTKFLQSLNLSIDAYRLTTFIFGMVMHNYFTLEQRKNHHGYKPNKEKPKQITKEVMQLLNCGIFAYKQ